MKTAVIQAADAARWQEALGRFVDGDIYFLPAYHRAYELNGDGTALAFCAEEGANCLFYPFMLRSIERVGSERVTEPYCDLETVYGYSGPLSTTNEPEFLALAWQAFTQWCRDQRVVAEFIRFNPFLASQHWAAPESQVILDRQTVVVRLDGTEADLWSAYPPVQRRNIRKALRSGLIAEAVPVEQGLGTFQILYASTMDRLGSTAYYYFSPAYFASWGQQLAQHTKLLVVRQGDQWAAAGLYLLYGDRIHYHLGASDGRYRDSAANNLLHHAVARWGQAAGYRWLHLGGGRTPDPGDSLLRFKASFSNARLDFYVGRRVHDPSTYADLCAAWTRQVSAQRRPNYFLLYRLAVEA